MKLKGNIAISMLKPHSHRFLKVPLLLLIPQYHIYHSHTIIEPHSYHLIQELPPTHTVSYKNPLLLLLWLILVFVSLYNSDSQDMNSHTYILNTTYGPPKHWV